MKNKMPAMRSGCFQPKLTKAGNNDGLMKNGRRLKLCKFVFLGEKKEMNKWCWDQCVTLSFSVKVRKGQESYGSRSPTVIF